MAKTTPIIKTFEAGPATIRLVQFIARVPSPIKARMAVDVVDAPLDTLGLKAMRDFCDPLLRIDAKDKKKK